MGDYFTHNYKGAVVTAVRHIGLLNGVSLPPASMLTQAVASQDGNHAALLTYLTASLFYEQPSENLPCPIAIRSKRETDFNIHT